MYFIGITGGVGAGKSTVLSLLEKIANCRVMLADQVAADLLTPGHDCFDKVVALPWPKPILDEAGFIDRPIMARFLYSSEELRQAVNAIVHPAVEAEVLHQVEIEKNAHNIEYLFFEAALLIECGYGTLVDEMWYIYARPQVRRERLKASRGYSDERIDAMLASQLSDQEFRGQADRVIDNSDTEEETLSQLKEAIAALTND